MTRLKPSAETLGSLQPRGDAVRAPQPSPTSRATRWLRAGGAPSGRYRSPSRFNLVPTPFRFPEPNQFPRLSAHWSSDPVTLSRLSDRRKPPRAPADGSAGATPLGLVGVSSWRPWWAGAPLLEPAHDRTVGRVHCPKWSLDLFLLQGLPLETRWLPASALWEGLDRSWFDTTCFLAYGTCVCRRCTLLGYSG